ncbi:MAG: LacI family DNA-binding transcriptional regulator [Kiritimatiellae bacterium]|nr:LacI family DNA-binding transcriptional regulator [Kiritimatiellia bacterium]MDD5519929.1 LacI family DNA-binding transcriptional regulator [Kiritimatiellia bacterium]
MKVTQKDIAVRLNVSPSLVSRALTGTADVIGASEKTVKRIQEEAGRLNYHPSAAALALRGRPTGTLGLVIKDFDDPFFGHMVRELQRLAREAGYSLIMTGCDSKDSTTMDLFSLTKFGLDGLVLCGSDFLPDGLDALISTGLRVVQIGVGKKHNGVTAVCVDQARGMELLLRHLVELGHSQVGYVGDNSDPNRRRENLLATTMRKMGMTIRREWFIRSGKTGPDAGYEGMMHLIKIGHGALPTAVVMADDAFAITALRACHENGVEVPADLSIVGVDDIPFARMTIPALTTVRQPTEKLVRAAFSLIVGNGETKNRDCMVIEPELVVRESCAKPVR